MSEQKERGDIEQALNELVESTRLGLGEGVTAAHKRLNALGVSVKRRNGALRGLAAEESDEAEPLKVVPVERRAPGPSATAAVSSEPKVVVKTDDTDTDKA